MTVNVNGEEVELVVIPEAPEAVVTTHCLPLLVGAVSAATVNDGVVKPVCAEPVTGLERLTVIVTSEWIREALLVLRNGESEGIKELFPRR